MTTKGDTVLILDGSSNVVPAIVRDIGSGTVDTLYAASSGWGPATGLTPVANVGALTAGTYAPYHDDGCCAPPAAGVDPGLAANTARQPSATRPTLVSVSGSWSWNLTAIGTATATATLKSDAASTPTTARQTAPFSRGIGVGVTVADSGTMPFSMTYVVPAGHFYVIATTGAGLSFTVQEQTL